MAGAPHRCGPSGDNECARSCPVGEIAPVQRRSASVVSGSSMCGCEPAGPGCADPCELLVAAKEASMLEAAIDGASLALPVGVARVNRRELLGHRPTTALFCFGRSSDIWLSSSGSLPKIQGEGALSRALGCEQGVQVNLVGFRALVTGRRTLSRGPPVPSSLEAVPRSGDWPRADAAAWWERFREARRPSAHQRCAHPDHHRRPRRARRTLGVTGAAMNRREVTSGPRGVVTSPPSTTARCSLDRERLPSASRRFRECHRPC